MNRFVFLYFIVTENNVCSIFLTSFSAIRATCQNKGSSCLPSGPSASEFITSSLSKELQSFRCLVVYEYDF